MMLHAYLADVYCTIILPLSAMFTAMIKELVFGFEIDGLEDLHIVLYKLT